MPGFQGLFLRLCADQVHLCLYLTSYLEKCTGSHSRTVLHNEDDHCYPNKKGNMGDSLAEWLIFKDFGNSWLHISQLGFGYIPQILIESF